VTDTARVEVHELRGGVEPYSATLQTQAGGMQMLHAHSHHAHIHGTPFEVQAVLCNARTRGPTTQIFICFRRPVTADDLELGVAVERHGDFVQQIKQAAIERMFVARAEIAEEVLQARQHLGRTTASLEERKHATFGRMHVVQA